MKKPQHCAQEWLEMKPAEGGRICGQCEKTIVDFSNMNWKEIQSLQAAHSNSLCGMYAKRQLKHWGQEPPSRTKSYASGIAMASLLLTGTGLSSTTSMAQTTEVENLPSDSTQLTTNNPQPTPKDTATVLTGAVMDENGELIFGANVYLMSNLTTGTVTNINGEFRLPTKRTFAELEQDTLVVAYIGYEPLQVSLLEWIKAPAPLQVQMREKAEIIAFYTKPPTLHRRAKWKVKSWFKKPY